MVFILPFFLFALLVVGTLFCWLSHPTEDVGFTLPIDTHTSYRNRQNGLLYQKTPDAFPCQPPHYYI